MYSRHAQTNNRVALPRDTARVPCATVYRGSTFKMHLLQLFTLSGCSRSYCYCCCTGRFSSLSRRWSTRRSPDRTRGRVRISRRKQYIVGEASQPIIMRAASAQTVDRVLGVLVAVCASAVLVAIGARAGSSLSTLLRLTYNEASQASSSSSKKKQKGRSDHPRRPREEQGRDSSAAEGNSDNSSSSSSSPQDGEGDGDAYHAYAYGARSAAVRRRAGGGGDEGEGRLVMHCGSCHCGGLVFEVKASEHLVAIEGPSKVRDCALLGGERVFAREANMSLVDIYLACRRCQNRIYKSTCTNNSSMVVVLT